MTETNFERFVARVKNIFCDWGISKPTTPKDGVFYGNTAPLWRCPYPILFLLCSIGHFIIFIIEICINAFVVNFSGNCESTSIGVRDLLVFLSLLCALQQFYMSRSDICTDKQWCRYITIGIFLETILLILSIAAGLTVTGSCKTIDQSEYDISITFGLIGIIEAGFFTVVIGFTIYKLYCKGNLAYNPEP